MKERRDFLIMIDVKHSVFHLHTAWWSCLLRVTKNGLLEQVHFGAPISKKDVDALAVKPGLGWGSSILLDEKDPASCADALPLAWSGSGRGDYRESPIELEDENGPLPASFRYVKHKIHKGGVLTRFLPQAQNGEETLEIILEQPENHLRLKLYFTVFPTVLTRRAVLENTGAAPVYIRKMMSWSIDLPGRYQMTTFDGGWIREMQKHTVPVEESRVVNESVTGFSSHRHNPGFLLAEPQTTEEHGTAYGFNLIYSGNHYAGVQRSLQGLNRVMQGISPSNFRWEVQPGSFFETPEGVLAWSGNGFSGLSLRMHDFITEHIIPEFWQKRPRPVLYNSWEGCMFDFNERRLLGLAKKAKKLGCELFVLDDGWFGARKNDTAGLGDYDVNKRKLPHGLKGLAKKINDLGMEFGLWFEPEAVNPQSHLYSLHPNWILKDNLPPLTGRHELLLDLTKPEVRDYIVDAVSAILGDTNITYVKWDMNRHSTALGAKAHAYILGLYDVLRRIFVPRPQVLLETCSSGGNRFDLGMLTFSPQIWCSDDTDPIERLEIQNSLSYLYPQSTMGAHVSAAPHAQTLRNTPLTTRGNVSFFGVLGYELDLDHLLPVEEKEIAAQIEYYKAHREVFQFGAFRRLMTEEGIGWQVSDAGLHMAGLFHKLVSAAPGYERLRLRGLKPETEYHVESRPQNLRIGPFGGLLKHVAPVDINPNGAVLRTVDHRATMPDAKEDFTATGSALMAGWMLPPRFSGTGYDKNQRSQGDFGSTVYEIREKT